MANTLVLGTQWGDEGKGKIVDLLARKKKFKTVVRYQGGSNAGHTVVVGKEKYAFHLLPSGMLYPSKTCLIGNGVIINPKVLLAEIDLLESRVGLKHAKLLISEKTHLIMPWHLVRDSISGGRIGTTGRGIGPTYSDYVGRRGIRLIDTRSKKRFSQRVKEELVWNKKLIKLMLEYYQLTKSQRDKLRLRTQLNNKKIINDYWLWLGRLKKNSLIEIGDVSLFLDQLQEQKKDILFEGAQATLLDIAHGTYPFVTSSNPTLGGLYLGTGFRPRKLKILGVAKAYTTRVGAGPFPTELVGKIGQRLRKVGHEYGTTTGRPRRCGWLDLTILKYAKIINGLDALALTKLDVLTGLSFLKVAVGYKINGQIVDVFDVDGERLKKAKVVYKVFPGWKKEITTIKRFDQLPTNCQKYVNFIESFLGIPIKIISNGAQRGAFINHD